MSEFDLSRRVFLQTAFAGVSLIALGCSGEEIEGVHNGSVSVFTEIPNSETLSFRKRPVRSQDAVINFNQSEVVEYALTLKRFRITFPEIVRGDNILGDQAGTSRWIKVKGVIVRHDYDLLASQDAPITRQQEGYINLNQEIQPFLSWDKNLELIRPDRYGVYHTPNGRIISAERIGSVTPLNS